MSEVEILPQPAARARCRRWIGFAGEKEPFKIHMGPGAAASAAACGSNIRRTFAEFNQVESVAPRLAGQPPSRTPIECHFRAGLLKDKIGRASCRERV